MSERFIRERELRESVEERHGPLRDVEVPKSLEDVRRLATSDPDLFNALYEAGRLGRDALGGNGSR